MVPPRDTASPCLWLAVVVAAVVPAEDEVLLVVVDGEAQGEAQRAVRRSLS